MKSNTQEKNDLFFHLKELSEGNRRFENAFQAISRMILGDPKKIEKVNICGRTMYDFLIFREGKKHIVAMHEELNSLVSFLKDAAEGGSSKEMAFVLVGEPGNGKTYTIDYLSDIYRKFISLPGNRKYTFKFVGLDKFGKYGSITEVESQTYEDPMILAMNLFDDVEQTKKFLVENGLKEKDLEKIYENWRPLGACTHYIWQEIRNLFDGDISKMLELVKIVPVPLIESLGTVTGKYPAKDKITSSSVDLLGEESIQRLLHLSDTLNPYRFDLRRGALARVAGGGIHFADEIFKNKKDLVQVYLGVIQNRNIEIDGFKWPIDTFIIATSNNAEFNRFRAENEEAPIIDRCRICYVSHNTNYRLQEALTSYAIGSKKKTTVLGDGLHQDPNLNYAASVLFTLTRLPHSEKLTEIEMMKLAAGEVAGEKGIKNLTEVIETVNRSQDVTKRWGQKGLGQRNLGRALQLLIESPLTSEGKCMFAYDIFSAAERIVLDYVPESSDRDKFLADIRLAKNLFRERIQTEMFNAYMDDPSAMKKSVMSYVNMIIAEGSDSLGPEKIWRYKDPQTGKVTAIKIDEKYIAAVEERLGLKSQQLRESFRSTIRSAYGQKVVTDPNYDFMDNIELVKAVTEVRLKSDVSGAGSLVGALANRTNEENQKLYNRVIETMGEKLHYCTTCAQKTVEYFCSKDDEN